MKLFKKRDILIFACILAIALAGAVYSWLRPFDGEPAVAIYIDGELTDRFMLGGGYYSELPIQTFYGINMLIISDGMAWVQDSDCANKLCIRQGAISRPGDIIVCAPHRLVAKVEAVEP